MDQLAIGEVARRAGMRTSAIRYYESIGVLPAPSRVNGRRFYDASVLSKLELIHLAQWASFTVPEIKMLLNGFAPDVSPSERWQVMSARKLAEVDAAIAQLQVSRQILEKTLQCSCATLDDCSSAEC